MSDQIYAGNDCPVRWADAQDSNTGNYLNAATVTAQLYDEDNEAVGSPVTLALEAGSTTGDYLGTIQSSAIDAGFDVDDFYKLVIDLAEGAVNGRRVITGTVKELPLDG